MSDGKKGKRGARPIYFVCSAIKKEQLVSEMILSDDKDHAIASFKEKNKVAPVVTDGPFYQVKKGAADQADDRATVPVDLTKVGFSGSKYEGIYKGWKTIAHGLDAIDAYKQDELVYIHPTEAVAAGAPKPRFGSAKPIIRLANLEGATKS